MSYIDTHSHIYSDTFDDDRKAVLERARNAGLSRVLMPAIDSSTHVNMLALDKAYPGFCHSMMGLHPCSVKDNYKEELAIVQSYLENHKFIAVGEIGLDFHWDLAHTDQQVAAFHQQIEWALHYDIPIVIHSRDSTDECIQIVKEHQRGDLKGVFHCFSGSAEQAGQINALGLYLGIGGVLTFKNAGLDKAIKGLDLAFLLLETDAPYLAPVPYRGKRNEPSYLVHVAQRLADLNQKSIEEVARITTANAEKLFGL